MKKEQDISTSQYINLYVNSFIAIYPFLVIPNIYGYFSGPRYIVMTIWGLIGIYIIYRIKGSVDELIKSHSLMMISLACFIVLGGITTIKAINPYTAWIGVFGTNITINMKDGGRLLVDSNRFTGLTTYLWCVVLFIIIGCRQYQKSTIKIICTMASIVSIISIFQFFGIDIVPHEMEKTGWVYGTMGNPNFLGTYTVFILPASLFLYLKEKKNIWLVFSTFIYCGLLVSNTRGSWLAFACMYIILLVYHLKKRDRYKRVILATSILFAITVAFFTLKNGSLLSRFLTISNEMEQAIKFNDGAGSFRMYIWKEIAKILPKHWMWGMGLDNLIYAGIVVPMGGIVDKAHNIYLEILITMGLFTLTSYIVFISQVLRKWKNEDGYIYFLMIVTYLIQGFFNVDVIMVMPFLWIVMGLLVSNKYTDN